MKGLGSVATAAVLALAGTAAACPDKTQWGETYEATGAELYSAKGADVVAGGSNRLASCPIRAKNYSGRLPGYVASVPDFSIQVTQLGGYSLAIRTQGDCDTTLLVNTANENWYFDDDDNGAGQAEIYLTRPSEGIYDFWIGTYDSETCTARLVLETY